MRNKYVLIFLFMLFVFGISNMQNAQAVIEVYDANDQHLGELVPNNKHHLNTVVNDPSDAAIVFCNPNSGLFIGINLITGDLCFTELYFQSDNCEGQPYIPFNKMYVVYRNGARCWTGVHAIPSYLTTRYYLDIDGTCAYTGPTWTNTMYFVPAIEIPEESLGISLPVALPLRFEYVDCCQNSDHRHKKNKKR